jgi:dephospho-CoA kinase
MKLFGLTGGTGMGKSAAAALLQERRVPVIDTDVLARRVVEPGQPALREIEREFGKEMIAPDGQLRRPDLARLVFSNAAARRRLEAILHPLIRDLWRQQVTAWRAERLPVAVVMIPLLFETGAEAEFDSVVCVACSASTQQARLSARGWSVDQIAARLSAQWPIERKAAKADYLVWTEGDLAILDAQLERIFPACFPSPCQSFP